jgi:hypothetical protein
MIRKVPVSFDGLKIAGASLSVRFQYETRAIASNLRANTFNGLSASRLKNQPLALGRGFREAQNQRNECVVRIIYIRGI